MSGTREGGALTAKTNKEKWGKDFYKEIGKLGGQRKVKKGFACMDSEKVAAAGRLGGTRSRRGKNHEV
jgi:uncharacterized protein